MFKEMQVETDFLIAADVGNSGIKFGLFDGSQERISRRFSIPLEVWTNRPDGFRFRGPETARFSWAISSVNPARTRELEQWIALNRPTEPITMIDAASVPLKCELDAPEKVGTDRLLAAYAAWLWASGVFSEQRARPILVCDLGTATTIDLVSRQGMFQGGAILPGFQAAADSLHRATALIPQFDVRQITREEYPGDTTEKAIRCGLFWGTVGAILQCAQRSGPETLLVLTGGNARIIVPTLRESFSPETVHFLPNLVLMGIAFVCSTKQDEISDAENRGVDNSV